MSQDSAFQQPLIDFVETRYPRKTSRRLENFFLSAAFFCWFLLGILTLVGIRDSITIPWPFANRVLLSLFLLSTFMYFRMYTRSTAPTKIEDLIWINFMAGAFMFVCLLGADLIPSLVYPSEKLQTPFSQDIINHFKTGFTAIFLANTFYSFKTLTLYRKSSYLIWLWNFFEPLLLTSLTIPIFLPEPSHPFSLGTGIVLLALGLLIVPHLKWVAYLNFSQKLIGLLLFLLLFLISGVFLHELYETSWLSESNQITITNDLTKPIFIAGAFTFISSYAATSALVLLFNLPTSSVVEQKIGEVDDFHKLISNTQTAEHESQISKILLDNCVAPHLADAAWVEIFNDDSHTDLKEFKTRNMGNDEAFTMKAIARKHKLNYHHELTKFRDVRHYLNGGQKKVTRFRSLVMIPLSFQGKPLGLIGLVKKTPRGFGRELVRNFQSWTDHASVALVNNFNMMKALEHERSQEKIKIAKEAQERLFPVPKHWENNPVIQFAGSCEAADDIGGDYYDIYKLSDQLSAVVIADVCGHGTEAAFSANQMKGIFQSLVQVAKSPSEFIFYANNALFHCLERGKFVTLSILYIDKEKQEIRIANAGHCPTLFHSKEKDEAVLLKAQKKLCLGSIEGEGYRPYLQEQTIQYQAGDSILLFTDGIYEASNFNREQFGLDRLKEFMEQHADLPPQIFLEKLKREVNSFSAVSGIHDDHTCVAIKLK